jgi:hypothetical protein
MDLKSSSRRQNSASVFPRLLPALSLPLRSHGNHMARALLGMR